MALLYYTNTKILISGAILRTLGNASAGTYTPFTIGMTVYKGTAPAPSAIEASWTSYNSSSADYLVHFTNATWAMLSVSPLITISAVPTVQAPVASGTATWAILWAGQPTAPQLASGTLPFSNFLVVNVSDAVGDGVVRFSSTALAAGVPVTVLDGSMAVNL